ncbi:uncharacterized protein B0T15DRAFT_508178 [Chaetomium strumarium]|uniref:Uncharacterized protein n=1 Tax=Chaetomium strumarium TaxID=1170767 RepID=A0AAJ0H4H9_9PEZI|nr:hypothetical protein B0T15DRAFT_508178 [Chaetomium strumarium]
MPLFSRHAEPVQQPAPQPVYEEPPKKHGLFGSRRHSPTQVHPNAAADGGYGVNGTRTSSISPEREHHGGGGIFRRSTNASSSTYGSERGSGGLLRRSFGHGNGSMAEMDPSIVEARQRVMNAEAAEREADRALIAARESVREAHEHVRRLELEAKEEARLAKIKQHHAKEFSKRGQQLGRFGA